MRCAVSAAVAVIDAAERERAAVRPPEDLRVAELRGMLGGVHLGEPGLSTVGRREVIRPLTMRLLITRPTFLLALFRMIVSLLRCGGEFRLAVGEI
jgi:hypothetical protein